MRLGEMLIGFGCQRQKEIDLWEDLNMRRRIILR
jgi:hypothetical protein